MAQEQAAFAPDAAEVVATYPVLGPVALRDLRGRDLTKMEWLDLYDSSPCIVRLEDAKAEGMVPDVVHFYRPWRWAGVTDSLLDPSEPWIRYAAGAMGLAAPANDCPAAHAGDAVFLSKELRRLLTVPFSCGSIRYEDFRACPV